MGRDGESSAVLSVASRISIHSPRMGRDRYLRGHAERTAGFQSTLPAWGETIVGYWAVLTVKFQSTLPAWGETGIFESLDEFYSISIHSPRMGRDGRRGQVHGNYALFQSTLPAWGETQPAGLVLLFVKFQSTLPAWGETHPLQMLSHFVRNFNPLSPHGERRDYRLFCRHAFYFNPLSPHGERQVGTSTYSVQFPISIHSPRMGRDR